ncbi:high-affinity nickel-transporter [Myxacorys almedinensis A]|uniref:High-affinity nickel-transporter n=2 Tax=Myxacorys TaxID=2056239 RepID=A0A8J8CNI8_9CYAN|nr:high-affinity nickel-transporter [Myxacorys almedinensis A]
MRTLLHRLTWIATIVAVFLWMPAADAHPLGNFTINHYAGVHVAHDGAVEMEYILDMAEIPAFQEINQMDGNHNRNAEPAETVNYPDRKCREVNSQLRMQVNHQPLALSLNTASVEFPPGMGGLATLRLTCGFRSESSRAIANGSPSVEANQLIEFEDNVYPQRLGWREVVVTAADHGSLKSNASASSITKRLTEYPNEFPSHLLDQRRASFEINPSLPSQSTVQAATPSERLRQVWIGRNNDAFTRLVTSEEYDFSALLLALAIAFVWGGLHALSPGHGKTVVGAYLVGSRSKAHHALFLGLTITLTHTAGIFALGLVMLGTSQFMLTEQLYPWLSGLSGMLMTGIGVNLGINQLRRSQVLPWIRRQGEANHARGGSRDQAAHDHSHEQLTLHHPQHAHIPDRDTPIHPCDLDHPDDLIHGHKTHSHLPLGADAGITWSSILALGISGGLLPCPSALVVLLSAIALGRVGFGLVLVSAFSLGLAAVLTGVGLLLVYAKDLFERLPLQTPQSNLVPAASALLITLVGLGITTKALLGHTL